MNRMLALANITFREGLRNRSFFGILLFSLFILILNVSLAGFFMRDIGKVSADMNLSALSFAGLLLVFFVGINLIAKDIDKKTIQLVLSKPITRHNYIWGKYIGIVAFIFVSLSVLVIMSSFTMLILQSIYSNYFGNFSWISYFTACFFIFIKLSMVSSIAIFFSAITSSSFITLIFSTCVYFVGISIEEVVFYLRSQWAAEKISISETLEQFIGAVSYIVPNLAAFDFKVEAAHGLPISAERFCLSLGYGLTYSVILLLMASIIFSRREFN